MRFQLQRGFGIAPVPPGRFREACVPTPIAELLTAMQVFDSLAENSLTKEVNAPLWPLIPCHGETVIPAAKNLRRQAIDILLFFGGNDDGFHFSNEMTAAVSFLNSQVIETEDFRGAEG